MGIPQLSHGILLIVDRSADTADPAIKVTQEAIPDYDISKKTPKI